MTKCSLDFEVRSAQNLKKAGAFRWLEDPSSAILCLAYSIDGAAPWLWYPGFPLVPEELKDPGVSYLDGTTPPEDLFKCINEGAELWAHNAAFERAVFEIICGPRLGWPIPRPDQWRCTMAMCAAHALPLSLEGAGRVLGLQERKDVEGKKLMLKLTSPRKATKSDWSKWHEDPKDLQKVFEYCKQDVRSEMALARALRPLSKAELKIYHVDQAINFRGIKVDLELCQKAQLAGEQRKAKLEAEVKEITDGEVTTLGQIKKQLEWLASRGVPLPDLTKETVRDTLFEDTEVGDTPDNPMDPKARRLLELRAAGGKTSVAKYNRFQIMACEDGRFRGGYQYHGARTGRWAGRGVQLHNLPKGVGQEEQEEVIGALKEGGLPLMELLWKDPIARLSKIIRGVLIPEPGKKFVIADYAAIEARGVFWLSGQEDLLDLYRAGECLYSWMAGKVFDCDSADILVGHKAGDPIMTFRRFVGKQLVLGCGYGMGWKRFVTYCADMGSAVGPELAKLAVQTYRERAPLVKAFWRGLERAAINAVRNPGEQCNFRMTKWKKVGAFLHCKLPSGRLLSYFKPYAKKELVRHKDEETGEIKEWEAWKLRYFGMQDHRWGPIATFGGKLTENICQGVTRDLMALAMRDLEDQGKPIVLHSHDEIGIEVDMGYPVQDLVDVMEDGPPWAEGLPIKVEGFECSRYKK